MKLLESMCNPLGEVLIRNGCKLEAFPDQVHPLIVWGKVFGEEVINSGNVWRIRFHGYELVGVLLRHVLGVY